MGESDGYFYIVQLLPEDAPLILKLGYTRSLKSRMIAYRTVCTAANILKSWQCPARYERPAITYITGGSCQTIGRETYRVDSIESAIARADAFFALSTEEKEAKAQRIKEVREQRRSLSELLQDAELWKRGKYRPRNRVDKQRMRKYAALK